MKIVSSIRGVPIRLTSERWEHITRRHLEMQGQQEKVLKTILKPNLIQKGDEGTLIAIRYYSKTPLTNKYCVVVYREVSRDDGFIITAYFTNKSAEWREILWRR